jgi:hypothetical protein
MALTEDQLHALEEALARGERPVTFADKTVEYRSVEELEVAIRMVKRSLFEQAQATGLWPGRFASADPPQYPQRFLTMIDQPPLCLTDDSVEREEEPEAAHRPPCRHLCRGCTAERQARRRRESQCRHLDPLPSNRADSEVPSC